MTTQDIVSSIPFRAFHNALRILRSIDDDELVGAGVADNRLDLLMFKRHPISFFVCADDPTKAAIWKLIQDRQPPELRDFAAAVPTDATEAA